MKNLLRVLFVVALIVGFAVSPVLAKTTWNANSVWPPKNMHSVGLTEFAEKVKKATNGDLEMAVHTGGALGYKGPDLLKAVRDGLVPVSDMLISGVAGDEKVFQIVTLPFLVRNFDELRLLLDVSQPYFDKSAQKWGQKILYIAPWPGAGLWTKKKIITLEEMKGLKTRTYDKNGALVMEAVGATPFALPFSEVYTSLQTGLIDSVMTSTPTAVDAKFWEVLKYYQPLFITAATDMVTVNLKAFQKLPKAQQDALVKIGKEMEAAMWANVKTWDSEQEAISNKNGIETVKPSVKLIGELEKITENIRAEWLKTAPADGKKIYDEFMKKVKR
ncbi:MAG: 2,3-diketo-L-gulonate-binding periplasmic protein YiaO precursor [Syntrophaceae bacterium PtaU1.Bin231]|nr:MAG: 2,3-diketo-L-gulonate-binding periplasmic protein YiaO precursor [Syntrophaceae bacterium PtaU1.Bin231]